MMLFDILLAEGVRQGALEAHGQGDLIQLPASPSLGLEEGLLFAASICYGGKKKRGRKGQFPEISVGYFSDEQTFCCICRRVTLKRNTNTELYFPIDVTSESLLSRYAWKALLAT